jgi:alpha-tubulin suppressor-like RCC1 family protein
VIERNVMDLFHERAANSPVARQADRVVCPGDGTVWAWGVNSAGQLGDGTWASTGSPARVGLLGRLTAVSAGDDHTVALRNDGTVRAWGRDGYGQLGIRTLSVRTSPIAVDW